MRRFRRPDRQEVVEVTGVARTAVPGLTVVVFSKWDCCSRPLVLRHLSLPPPID